MCAISIFINLVKIKFYCKSELLKKHKRKQSLLNNLLKFQNFFLNIFTLRNFFIFIFNRIYLVYTTCFLFRNLIRESEIKNYHT